MFEVDELFDLTKEGAFNTLQEFKDFAAAASLEDIYSILKTGAFKTPEELDSFLKKKDDAELQLPGGSLELQELDTSSQDEIIDSELEEVIVPSPTSVRAKTRQSDLERIENQEIQLESNEPLQPVAKSVRAEVRKNDIASIEPRKKKDSETIEKKKAVLDLALVLPTLQYDKLDLQNQSFVSSLSTKFGITNEELLEEVKEKRNSTAKASKFQAYKNLFNLSDATIGEGILSIPSALFEFGAMISDPVNRALGLKETNLEAFEEALGTKKAIQSLVEEQEYREKQSALYRKENKIEGGLSENFFGEGNIQDGFYLLGESIAASMPVTLGIMAAAFSGVGIIPLAVGATAVMTGPELRKQKEEFPEQSKAENVLKAIGMAGSEMVFSTISQGTLGRVYKDIIFREGAKQGVKTFRTGLISMYETALKKTGPLAAGTGEGIEEVATQITQNLINGKAVFQGVPDAFIAGVGSGTAYGSPILAIKGGRTVKKYVKEEVLKNNIRTKLKPTKYSDIVNAFNSTDIKEIQFDLLSLKGAKEILENELKRRVGRDEMTQEDADRINQNFFDASTYEAKLKPLDLTQSQLVQATNLLKEKESLDKVIKQVGDPSLTKAQQNRVDEINQELAKLVTITETIKTENDANTIKSPAKVPEGQQPEVGGTVVEGDNQPTELAGETTQAQDETPLEPTQESEIEAEVSQSEIDDLLSEIERSEDQGTLEENIGEKAYMNGKEGMIKIDDDNANTIVFENNDEIINLGRLDLDGSVLIADKDISLIPPEGMDVTKSGESSDVVSLDGVKYKFIGRSRDKKGKAVVKLKEEESGLIKRFVGEKAERILKDQALKKPKKRIDVADIKEKRESQDPMMTQESYESKALEEVIELERQANEELSAFEQEVLDRAAEQTENTDLIQIGENIFQVTQKPDGKVTVSQMRMDGKLVPVFDEKKRTEATENFQKEKSDKEKALIEEAENKIGEYKKEQEDKIISFLDKAIKETSSQGRAFDATLGLPMFVVNSSLKIIKASYKAGKALSQAIQDGIIHLKKQGYGVNELEYKKFVLNNLTDSNKKPKTPPLQKKDPDVKVDKKDKTQKSKTKKQVNKELERKRKQAKKNINSKIGSAKDLGPILEELFSVDNSLIPDDKLSTYNKLLESFGERAKVLTLPEAGTVMEEATDILSNLKEETPKESKPRAKKVKVIPVIADIVKKKVDTSRVPEGPSRDLADYLNNLSVSDIERLITEKDGEKNYSEVNNLIKVLNNISKGYDQTNQAGEIQRIIEGSKSAEKMQDSVSKIKFKFLLQFIERGVAKLKSAFTDRSKILEQIRTAPLIYLDEALGNFNKSALVRETILPIASAYSKFESQFLKRVSGPLGKAINLLEQGKGKVTRRTRSKAIEGSVKIYTFQLAREYESNPNRNDVYPALDYLNATIKHLEANEFSKTLLKQKIKTLKKIKEDFTVDGKIDTNKLYNSLTENEKKAEKLSSEVNSSLASEALYTSQLRGNRLDQYVNYVHHQVLRTDKKNQEILDEKKAKMSNPSTKAGIIEQRTKGVKPLNFDFISASQNAAKDLLLDYHMTQPLRIVRKALNDLKSNIDGDSKITKEQKEIVNAIDESFVEVIEKVFGSTYSNSSNPIFNFIKTTSYQNSLASIPRAGIEALSNINHIIFVNPLGFARGIKKFGTSLVRGGIDYSGFLESIGSINTLKLVRKSTLTSKFADNNLFTNDEVKSFGEMGKTMEMMNYIYQNSIGIPLRNIYKATDNIASALMSGPDMVLAAPLYMDTFVQTFKKETGISLSLKDINEIGDGTSEYLKTNKEAIKEARIKSDQENTTFSTSASPFAGPLKSKMDPTETNSMKRIIKEADNFMSNFRFFEFANVQRAVRALFVNGDINRTQAIGLLAGNIARMTAYTASYQFTMQAFDAFITQGTDLDIEPGEEEEEATDINRLKRAFIGTGVALILQRSFGNLASFAIAGGVEYLNELYGASLRDQREYDSFNDNVTFNPVRFDKMFAGGELIKQSTMALGGAYTYPIRTAERLTTVIGRSQTSTKKSTREKYEKELIQRMLPQVMQNLRLLPFSKDIIRPITKSLFKKEPPKVIARKWTRQDLINAKGDPALMMFIRDEIRKQSRK